MTVALGHVCCYPGCFRKAMPGSRYCEEHQGANDKYYESRRLTRTQRGYSNRWLMAARMFLAAHPFCVECARRGMVTAATEVDHIIPHKGNMKLFWDRSNWQPLCHACHSRKTALEDGGFGRDPGGGSKKNPQRP